MIVSIHNTEINLETTWGILYQTIMDSRDGRCWDRDVYEELIGILESLEFDYDAQLSEEMFLYFLTAFQTYSQLLPTVEMLRTSGMNRITKTRLYQIPLYTSLVDECFSNIARCLLLALGVAHNKDYKSQQTIKPMVNVLKKEGLTRLAKVVNVNFRNAVSHGGVHIMQDGHILEYTYMIDNKRERSQLNIGTLYSNTNTLFDALSAALISILVFFNSRNVFENANRFSDKYAQEMIYGMHCSCLECRCIDIFPSGSVSQINLVFQVSNTSRDFIFEKAGEILVNFFNLVPGYDQYSISFTHERLPSNFIRVKAEEIKTIIDPGFPCITLAELALKRRDFLWWDASNEEINLQESKFFQFPSYETEGLKIYDIEDASLTDRKRLRGKAFVGNTEDKNEILVYVNEAIDWMKSLYNAANSAMVIKHGSMDADCIYIDFYHDDMRRSRELTQENNNFICEVEYCPNTDFLLAESNGFIQYLYRNSERYDDVKILWRERRYLTVVRGVKVGRNEPCPCGSGKKFKKCCGA